jgi:hypothetical protein
VTREEVDALWKETVRKGEALRACAGPHDFVDLTPDKPLNKTWRCKLCGGEMGTVAKGAYEQGLKHGRAHP